MLEDQGIKRGVSKVNITRQFIFLALGWSVFTLAIMAIDMRSTWLKNIEAAKLQASVALDKDIQYRMWSARLGGVYGVVSEQLKPNPYLNVKSRDVVTTEGVELTLINPAYMTRQVHDLADNNTTLSGHLSSLTPLRPENKPDEWEKKALVAFEEGTTELFEIVQKDNQSYMRSMRPIYVEESCLGCHVTQGYKVGDISGGHSVMIPMTKMRTLLVKHLFTDYLLYLVIWLIGLVGLWVGSKRLGREIAEQVEMETVLQDFKLSLDNINESVMMFDTNNLELFYSNHGASQLMEMTDEELFGKALPELIAEEDRYLLYSQLKPLFNLKLDSFTFESNFLNSKLAVIPVEMHVAYVIPREGAERFLVVVRDISERKNAEKEKESIQAKLLHAQKLESVGQLAAGIAHEINTPAQFVSANVEFFDEAFDEVASTIDVLQKDSVKAPLTSEKIDSLLTEVDWDYVKDELPIAIKQSRDGMERISSIVLAMKEFSHPGGKDKVFEDVNRIIEVTTTVCRNEWRYVANLEFDLAPGLPQVPCLKDELGQVILNLVINAAHSISAKNENNTANNDTSQLTDTILISTALKETSVEIAIKDSGTGIPEEISSRVFDPFFTTKEVGSGSGQGLAICRDVIENKHDGSLRFETEANNGTTFFIKLPIE